MSAEVLKLIDDLRAAVLRAAGAPPSLDASLRLLVPGMRQPMPESEGWVDDDDSPRIQDRPRRAWLESNPPGGRLGFVALPKSDASARMRDARQRLADLLANPMEATSAAYRSSCIDTFASAVLALDAEERGIGGR